MTHTNPRTFRFYDHWKRRGFSPKFAADKFQVAGEFVRKNRHASRRDRSESVALATARGPAGPSRRASRRGVPVIALAADEKLGNGSDGSRGLEGDSLPCAGRRRASTPALIALRQACPRSATTRASRSRPAPAGARRRAHLPGAPPSHNTMAAGGRSAVSRWSAQTTRRPSASGRPRGSRSTARSSDSMCCREMIRSASSC